MPDGQLFATITQRQEQHAALRHADSGRRPLGHRGLRPRAPDRAGPWVRRPRRERSQVRREESLSSHDLVGAQRLVGRRLEDLRRHRGSRPRRRWLRLHGRPEALRVLVAVRLRHASCRSRSACSSSFSSSGSRRLGGASRCGAPPSSSRYGILALMPLFIPIVLSMGHLFPWLGEHGGAKEHGAAEKHGSISLITPAYAQDHAAPAASAAAPGGHAAAPLRPLPLRRLRRTAPSTRRLRPVTARRLAPGSGRWPRRGSRRRGRCRACAARGARAHPQRRDRRRSPPYLNKNFFHLRALIYFVDLDRARGAPLRLLDAAGHHEGPEAHGRARRRFAPAGDVPVRAEPHVRRVRLGDVARADAGSRPSSASTTSPPASSRASRS